jgi:hypothetical protein
MDGVGRWVGGQTDRKKQERHEHGKNVSKSSGKTDIYGKVWLLDNSHKVETLKKVEEEKEQKEEATERKMRNE